MVRRAPAAPLGGRGGCARWAAAASPASPPRRGCHAPPFRAGLKELAATPAPDAAAAAAGRRAGGAGAGRKRLTAHDPKLVQALERLVDPVTRGDPMGPLLWTCSSAARLARELSAAGHPVSERTVNRLLHELGYSLQANRKTLEGAQHADRDAQFKHINRRGRAFQALRQPIVSVDTKKKELVGEFRNGGPGVASEGPAAAGQGARFRRQDARQGDPVRDLRRDR